MLQAVKTEFDKFESVLLSTQKKLENANSDLDKLIGVRTRAIRNRLTNVSKLESDKDINSILEVDDFEE